MPAMPKDNTQRVYQQALTDNSNSVNVNSVADATKSAEPIRLPIIKRIFDFTFALLFLVIFSPILLIVALLVRIFNGSPVLFQQERPGLMGKPFLIYKFRTMSRSCDAQGVPLSDQQRLTRLGKILRATSLDELPELFNVLRGDMSFVGPRPLLTEYLALYSPEQARRHLVRPGLTGWAQVHGRNAVSWEDRFKLDTWYVDNWSFALDLQILMQTVLVVLTRKGISAENHATMPKFTGS